MKFNVKHLYQQNNENYCKSKNIVCIDFSFKKIQLESGKHDLLTVTDSNF